MKKTPIILFAFILLFISCEKEIDMNASSNTSHIVVEGKIENDFPPYILLTKSFPANKDISLGNLSNFFIKNAKIFIYNNGDTIQLKEFSGDNIGEIPDSFQVDFANRMGFDVNDFGGSFPSLVTLYTVDFKTEGDAILKGKLGERYDLRIEAENQVLTATTTIPNAIVKFDTLWIEPHVNSEKYPDYFRLIGILSDNGQSTDYYRYATRADNEPWLTTTQSVFDDAFYNGKQFQIFVPKGNEYGRRPDNDEDFETQDYWYKEDSVLTFKLSLIDKEQYDFWRTLEANRSSQGNPFGSFVVVKSNIKGGGLGIWGGYASYIHHYNRF